MSYFQSGDTEYRIINAKIMTSYSISSPPCLEIICFSAGCLNMPISSSTNWEAWKWCHFQNRRITPIVIFTEALKSISLISKICPIKISKNFAFPQQEISIMTVMNTVFHVYFNFQSQVVFLAPTNSQTNSSSLQ